jgi:hypothetical protein
MLSKHIVHIALYAFGHFTLRERHLILYAFRAYVDTNICLSHDYVNAGDGYLKSMRCRIIATLYIAKDGNYNNYQKEENPACQNST